MTRLVAVMIVLGVIAVVEGDEVKKFEFYNKAVLKILPPSEYPRVMDLLTKAIKRYDVTPMYMIVANEIVNPRQDENKLIFNTQFADKDGNLFGYSFSYLNGKFSEERQPNRFKDEKITNLIKAGKIDDARKRAAGVIAKAAAMLTKRGS